MVMGFGTRWLLAGGIAAAMAASTLDAYAQLEPLEDGIEIGAWYLRPELGLRVRAEYRRNPADLGGDDYSSDAVLGDDYFMASPPVAARTSAVGDQWLVAERARLGLSAEYGLVSAKLLLQDARAFGIAPAADVGSDVGAFGELAPYEAYIHLRSDEREPFSELRVGRQRVHWGDGRLIGASDWSARARSLDAVRGWFHFGAVDAQVLAALLSTPGPVPHDYHLGAAVEEGSGAQLLGVHTEWSFIPLLNFDATFLARMARDPLPRTLTRSDVYVMDARVHGEKRGVRYALEGAVELGRVASFGVNRDLQAFGLAARVSWLTALPAKLTFGAAGSYASGDANHGDPSQTLTRFDPLLADSHANDGLMDLSGWSNRIDVGASVAATPVDPLTVRVAGRYVGLAEATDRWVTESLRTVGASPSNSSTHLGEELELELGYTPWESLSVGAGYGLMVLGEGGKTVLASAGKGSPALMHFAYLQTELVIP